MWYNGSTMRLSKISNKKLHIIVLTVLAALTFVMIVINNALFPQDSAIMIGRMALPANSLNGVVQLIMFVFGMIMTCIDYRIGARISYVMVALVTLYDLFGIMKTGSLGPLPGLLNALVCGGMILIISKQFRLLERESRTDYVTGLTNMRGFLDILNERIESKLPFTVVYFRIDNFRMINDNLGHDLGTKLLQDVSVRLIEMTHGKGSVCKTSSSEFALVLDADFNLNAFRKEMKEIFGGKFIFDDSEYPVYCYPRVYAGAVKYPEDAMDPTVLIKYADVALYHAIKSHNKSLVIFDAEMESEDVSQNRIEGIIKECLAGDYFYLMYQPQYDMQDKKLRGFETLIRTLLPDGSYIRPGEFIPVAEKTNLIIQIDRYVLKRALTEMAEFVKKSEDEILISVNMSANSIGREDFVDNIRATLEETEFPANRLEVEITEYSFAESGETTTANIEELRKMGVKIALDDFGTGYTSLAQLVKLPVNLLKIDKTLIDDIETNTTSRDFVNAIIYMGHLMGCDVISEGVETQMQLDLLREQNCDYVQGFIWDRPLYYEAAIAMIRTK